MLISTAVAVTATISARSSRALAVMGLRRTQAPSSCSDRRSVMNQASASSPPQIAASGIQASSVLK